MSDCRTGWSAQHMRVWAHIESCTDDACSRTCPVRRADELAGKQNHANDDMAFYWKTVCGAPFAEGKPRQIFCELMPDHSGQHEVYRDSTQISRLSKIEKEAS